MILRSSILNAGGDEELLLSIVNHAFADLQQILEHPHSPYIQRTCGSLADLESFFFAPVDGMADLLTSFDLDPDIFQSKAREMIAAAEIAEDEAFWNCDNAEEVDGQSDFFDVLGLPKEKAEKSRSKGRVPVALFTVTPKLIQPLLWKEVANV